MTTSMSSYYRRPHRPFTTLSSIPWQYSALSLRILYKIDYLLCCSEDDFEDINLKVNEDDDEKIVFKQPRKNVSLLILKDWSK